MVTRHDRRWWNIGATKIPEAERDVIHGVLADPAAEFYDILGADTPDDDDTFPVGADTAYSVLVTDEQAARLSDASNVRHIQPDELARPVVDVPTVRTLTYMGAAFPSVAAWHGTDVPVAILDQGTTSQVRFVHNMNLWARRYFSDIPTAGAEIWPDDIHGCLVSGCGVPYGGIVIDGIITNRNGDAPLSSLAAGIRWAADEGARVINISFGGLYNTQPVVADALTYIGSLDIEVYIAAGNDAINALSYPSAYSRTYTYVNSIIAFDETTDARGSFSNWTADATGATAGVLVAGYEADGNTRLWSGTSAASPHAASLCARLQTGGAMTARAAGAALRANLRNANRGAHQGGGVFELQRALAGFGAVTPNHSLLALL